MNSDIPTLMKWASFWDDIGGVSAIFVFVGVVGEAVDEFEILAKWIRLNLFPEWRKKVAKGGLLILITALAVEAVVAIQSHTTNEQIIDKLNKNLDQTTLHEIELTKLTKSLGLSNKELKKQVQQQDSDLKTIEARNNEFDSAIKRQRERNDGAISALKNEESRLYVARKDMLASAEKAATAAKIASKTEADMVTTLNAEREMREKMHELVTHRTLSDEQVADLVSKLKQYAGTPFDMLVTEEPDTVNIFCRISEVLEKAGWVWKAAPTMGALQWGIPGKPPAARVTTRGISIEIAESQKNKFNDAACALGNGLLANGIKVSALSAIPDDKMDKKFDPAVIHIVVGTRD